MVLLFDLTNTDKEGIEEDAELLKTKGMYGDLLNSPGYT